MAAVVGVASRAPQFALPMRGNGETVHTRGSIRVSASIIREELFRRVGRRLRFARSRAVPRAWEELGHDMKFGLLLLGATLAVGHLLFGFEWDKSAKAVGVAMPVVLALWVIGHSLAVLRDPSYHKKWKPFVSASHTGNGRPFIKFSLGCKTGITVANGMACEVRFPTGELSRETAEPNLPIPVPRAISEFRFAYGNGEYFADVPEAFPGQYEITWIEPRGNGRWREIVHYSEHLTF
jgi:hypothetical protein